MSVYQGHKNKHSGKKGNAMTPLNWMASVFEIVLIPSAATNITNWFGIAAFILAVLVIIFYAGIYIYFVRNDPDRLQTEQYNLESQQMLLDYSANTPIKLINGSALIVTNEKD